MPQPGEPPAPHPGGGSSTSICADVHMCAQAVSKQSFQLGLKGKKTQCHLLRRGPGAVCGEAKSWGRGSRGGFAGQEGSLGGGGGRWAGGLRHAGLSVLGSRRLSLLPAAPLITSPPLLPMWFIRPGKRGERQRGARGDSPGTALPSPATLLFAVPSAGSSHRVPVRRRTRPPRAVPARENQGLKSLSLLINTTT